MKAFFAEPLLANENVVVAQLTDIINKPTNFLTKNHKL